LLKYILSFFTMSYVLPTIDESVLSKLPFGVYILNQEGSIEYANEEMAKISGVNSAREMIGHKVLKNINYKKYGLLEYIEKGLKGQAFRIENIRYVSCLGKKDSYRRYHGIPIKNDQGRVEKLICIIEDVSFQTKQASDLKLSKKKYELITKYTKDLVYTLDIKEDLPFTFVSPSLGDFYGCKPSALIGKSSISRIHPDDIKKLKPKINFYTKISRIKLAKMLSQGVTETLIYRVKHKSGEWRYLESKLNFIENGIAGISRDITKTKEAREIIEANEKKFRAIFNNAATFIVVADQEGQIIDCNLRTKNEIKNGQQLIGNSFLAMVDQKYKQQTNELFLQTLRGGSNLYLESKLINKDNKTFYVSVYSNLIDAGNFKGVFFIIIDNDKKIKTEMALKESEAKIKTAMDTIPHAVLVLENWKITFANKAVFDVFGYTMEEIIGEKTNILYRNKDEYKEIVENFFTQLKNKSRHSEEFICCRKNNVEFIARVTANRFANESSEKKIMVMYEDISEQKHYEKKVIESEQRFRAIFEEASEAIFIKNNNFQYTHINSKTEKYLNLPSSQIIGKSDREFLKEEEATEIESIDKRVLQGEIVRIEKISRHKNKNTYYQITKVPIRDKQGKIIGLCGFVHDVSDYKIVQKNYQEEKELLEKYINIVPVILLVLDTKANIKVLNQAGQKALQIEKDNIHGLNWIESFIPEEEKEKISTVFKKIVNREENVNQFENHILTQKGAKRLISWHNSVIQDNQGNVVGVLSAGDDITETKQMQQKILSSAREWSDTFDSMADGISIHDKDFTIIGANQTFCDLLGISKDKILGEKCFKIIHQASNPIKACPMKLALNTKKRETTEYYDKGLHKWLSVTATPMFDKSGQVEKIIHVLRDITKDKETAKEILKRNQELEKFNKLMVGRELKMVELKKRLKELDPSFKTKDIDLNKIL
jgi:PAS domain S-box-containing protein